MNSEQKWVRSKDGWLAGVCQGLGERFGIEIWILRLIWILGFLCFGAGLFLYLVLAICLPREDQLDRAFDKKIFGVCSYLAVRYDLDVGMVRFLTVILAMSSFGFAIVAYLVMYISMPKTSANPPRGI